MLSFKKIQNGEKKLTGSELNKIKYHIKWPKILLAGKALECRTQDQKFGCSNPPMTYGNFCNQNLTKNVAQGTSYYER